MLSCPSFALEGAYDDRNARKGPRASVECRKPLGVSFNQGDRSFDSKDNGRDVLYVMFFTMSQLQEDGRMAKDVFSRETCGTTRQESSGLLQAGEKSGTHLFRQHGQ